MILFSYIKLILSMKQLLNDSLCYIILHKMKIIYVQWILDTIQYTIALFIYLSLLGSFCFRPVLMLVPPVR